MSAPPEHLALAAEFPAVTRDQWRAMVSAVLARSGVDEDLDPELALSSTTYDGITVKPLYTADDAPPVDAAGLPGQAPFVRGSSTPIGWDVRQRHADPDAERTRAAVLADLSNGTTSLWLVLGDAGLAVSDLAAALDGVYLDLAPVALDAGAQTRAAAEVYLRLVAEREIAAADVAGTLGADPIGLRARTGVAVDLQLLGELAAMAADYPNLRVATVDATIYHDAGGSDSDELAVAAAVGVAYLRSLTNGGPPASVGVAGGGVAGGGVANGGAPGIEDGGTPANAGVANGGPPGIEGVAAGGGGVAAGGGGVAAGGGGAGLSVDAALRAVEFRYAVTADQFLSIAKLRAARRVWDRIAVLSGAGAERHGQRQHAVTSAAMMTQRDPWVNLLRTTIACFAAAVGGADAITVAPFDAAIGRCDELARRIARNTQSILHDESSLARVIDAAGGSWYVESLTDQLAEAAWTKFTAIERAGGALSALDDGSIDRLLAAARDKRAEDIAHRRAPITGVSEYAYVGEEPVVRPLAPAVPGGGPLPRIRYAQDFEALRERCDAAESRPVVFLAALGPPAAHRARVGFASNLFQAGGIEPVVYGGPPGIEDGGTPANADGGAPANGGVANGGSPGIEGVAAGGGGGANGGPPGTEGVAAGGGGDLDEIVTAFRASGSTVACLCSASRVYADAAAPAAQALRAAGASYIWLAGQPGDSPTGYALVGGGTPIPGVDGYLYTGVDALSVLSTTLDSLGVG